MSSSSLWTLDRKLIGNMEVEFSNSWFFTPVALTVLFHKYMPLKKYNAIGNETSYLTAVMFDESIDSDLNNLINNSEIIEDRIVWELCNQQVFFSKDKNFVGNCIEHFIIMNKEYMNNYGEHIIERFKEISDKIKNIDADNNPYFVFKNSSCDDGVEYWFQKYDDNTDDYVKCSLLDLDKYVTEFVVIENSKMVEFIRNIDFKL